MKDSIKKVEEFHKAVGVPVGKSIALVDASHQRLHYDLMQEELLEFKQACQDKNLVKVLDGLADIQFVLFSSVIEHGLQEVFQEAFSEVCASNMSKVTTSGEVLRRPDGKVITRGENFFPPNLEGILIERGVDPASLKSRQSSASSDNDMGTSQETKK